MRETIQHYTQTQIKVNEHFVVRKDHMDVNEHERLSNITPLKQQWTIKISSPLFSIFSLAAILVGSRDQRTQFWKGAIQESFLQSLVDIGSVVSEEKIFFKFHPPFSNLHNRSKSAKVHRS